MKMCIKGHEMKNYRKYEELIATKVLQRVSL